MIYKAQWPDIWDSSNAPTITNAWVPDIPNIRPLLKWATSLQHIGFQKKI
jgi:hypothetical protein